MNRNDRDFLSVRASTEAHENPLATCRTRPEREFDRLVEHVFNHQKAVFHLPKPSDDSQTTIARYFYKDCYRTPDIRLGRGGSGAKVTVDDFIEEVILCGGDERRNHLFYLLGDVGVGKTAFLNALFTKYLKAHVDGGKLCFCASTSTNTATIKP